MRAILSALLLGLSAGAAWAGSIGGTVFEDRDRNGVQVGSEPGIVNVRLQLYGLAGTVVQQAQTAADGGYLFTGLSDGQYVVSIRERANLRASLVDVGADPHPVPGFPFGRPRYGSPPRLVSNLRRAASQGTSFRHTALGDSIGFGFNVCDSLFGDNGYIEPTTERLRQASAATVITDKQAIPGHETSHLLEPGASGDFPFTFNDIFYAIDQGSSLVSVSIGGNDFLGSEDGGDAAVAAALVTARRNLQEIFSSLASEIPATDLEVNTVYDNEEGEDGLHNLWAPIWDEVLREISWAQTRRVTLGEVYPEYAHEQGGQVLGQRDLICNDIFGLDGIHPVEEGYDVHEEKLWQAFGGVTLSGGSSRLDLDLGFLRLARSEEPDAFTDVTGGSTDPQLALSIDGAGALVPAGNQELRVSDFLPPQVPNADLAQVILKVRYRTTAAPIDDVYRFEASIDGTFSAPGSTASNWNTILPVVGSSGNDGAVDLAFPDQPQFRTVAAAVYAGSPTGGGATLSWDDLATLSVRVVTTAVGSPDAFSVEWDGAFVEIFTAPAGSLPAALRPKEARHRLRAGEVRGDAVRLVAAECRPADRPLLRRLLDEGAPPLRAQAVVGLACAGAHGPVRKAALGDADPGVRRSAARELVARGMADLATLGRLAGDADAGVRKVVARGLGRLAAAGGSDGLRSPDAGAAAVSLLRGLARDERRDVRVEAAAALLEWGDRSGVALLVEALGELPPSRRAAEALVTHGGAEPALLAALAGAEPARRATAASVLGRLERLPNGAREGLRPLLTDRERGVRLAAANALSRHGDGMALAALARADDLPAVDRAILLARYDEPRAHGVLARIASDPAAGRTARQTAARALAASADSRATALLEGLLVSEDPRVRRLAEAGLAKGTPAP